MPFTDVKAAVAHVFAAYDVPFVPQLVALERDVAGAAPMLRETLTGGMAAAFRQEWSITSLKS